MVTAQRGSCLAGLKRWTFLTIPILLFMNSISPSVSVYSADPTITQANDDQENWCKVALKIPVKPSSQYTHVSGNEENSSPPSDAVPQPIVALALSGGGYRAMLFHVGTLRRLNDSGLLPLISVVSSVSGGSVTSAYLAYRWNELKFDESDRATNFTEVLEAPLRELALETVDITSIAAGLLPFISSAGQQVREFDKHLFHGALLTDIAPGGRNEGARRTRPLFILNATNLQTGELWQFRPSAMGGLITHWVEPRNVRLAEAVAASSGFPPFLSPLIMELKDTDVKSDWHACGNYLDNPYGILHRHEPGRVFTQDDEALGSYRKTIYLVDGGVRDNLGISTLEEINRLRRLDGVNQGTVMLISDGGATTKLNDQPNSNWVSQLFRILNLLADQPDEVRISNLIRTSATRARDAGWTATEAFDECPSPDIPPALEAARRLITRDPKNDALAYWSIRRRPKLHRGFECPANITQWMVEEVRTLSSVPTAFRAVPNDLQTRLINWGYLAAHHGIPYVDAAWPDPKVRQRWLGPCALPYGPEATDPWGGAPSARDARCLSLSLPIRK